MNTQHAEHRYFAPMLMTQVDPLFDKEPTHEDLLAEQYGPLMRGRGWMQLDEIARLAGYKDKAPSYRHALRLIDAGIVEKRTEQKGSVRYSFYRWIGE